MSNDKKVTVGSGNVFADLGFANPEEELLKAKLDRELRAKRARAKPFVLGAVAFAQISAVEGIKLTPAMKRRAAKADKQGLTAAQRRRAIIKAYSK
ncbi:hypothetical protein [Bradyrhizobium sp. 190]|uniref:hypothetical protein n=1 Tax=Bradyrhizobium sp. 190 TaxID=2782658 RepID=UPI001FFB698A|nr:hypothetical protein [Bradyrhizobium sp. 190]